MKFVLPNFGIVPACYVFKIKKKRFTGRIASGVI